MRKSAFRWLGRSLVVVTAALASACASDAPLAPDRATTTAGRGAAVLDVSSGNRLPDLTACPQLAAPVGSTLVLQAFGIGVQIYKWNGTSWIFQNPLATLYADAGAHGKVADHFGGPTWKSNSGSQVVGTVDERCTVDAGSIQWLSLTGVSSGPGIFSQVNFIQRLNTVGGNAPATPGAFVGDEVKVPYTADYLFYKAP